MFVIISICDLDLDHIIFRRGQRRLQEVPLLLKRLICFHGFNSAPPLARVQIKRLFEGKVVCLDFLLECTFGKDDLLLDVRVTVRPLTIDFVTLAQRSHEEVDLAIPVIGEEATTTSFERDAVLERCFSAAYLNLLEEFIEAGDELIRRNCLFDRVHGAELWIDGDGVVRGLFHCERGLGYAHDH